MINTNNYGKDSEENLKPYIWNIKRELSHKVSGWGQASDKRVYTVWCEVGVGKGGWGLFIIVFLTLMNWKWKWRTWWKHGETLLLIKNKHQNICFKFVDVILKIFTRTRILTWSWRWWENKVNLWHHDRAMDP